MNRKTYGMRVALVVLVMACMSSSGLPADCGFSASEIAKYTANVHITSPQTQTYHTHTILLNFTFYTNIPESNISSIVFGGNIDGEIGYHDGNRLYLGTFEKPYRNFYSVPINVSDGSHLLWLQVNIGLGTMVKTPYHPEGVLMPTGDGIENLSQIVSFSVNTETVTPTPTMWTTPPAPSPAIPEFPVASVLLALVVASISLVYIKRRRSKRGVAVLLEEQAVL